jgi:hypothetical protein
MPDFTFDDVVRVKADAPENVHPGALAWVVMVFTESEREGEYFDRFPPGNVYSIEFEDGECLQVHESLIEAMGIVPP